MIETPTAAESGRGFDLIAEPGKQQIVITRVFDAPRDLVFKTYNDSDIAAQCWGPKGVTTTVDKMDAKSGGTWRYVNRAGSHEYGFRGVYHDVVPPERIVCTFEYEGMPGHVLLQTVTFETVGGGTKLTDQSIFQSVEDRDVALQSVIREGPEESMDRFAELLKQRQAS